MRKAVLLAIMVATIGSLAGAPTVRAQTTSASTDCVIQVSVTLSPGISATPSTGTITSDGETGTLKCGKTTGTYGVRARYGTDHPVSCSTFGGGEGTQTYTIDTKTSSEAMTFKVTKFEDGAASGTVKGDKVSGPFEATPTEGNCVSAPVTKAHVTIKFSMS